MATLSSTLFNSIEQHFLNVYNERLIIKSAKFLSGGCISQALKIDTNTGPLFLKWNSTGANDLFLREADSLKEFQKTKNEFLSYPKPILAKNIDNAPGYLLTTFLEQGRSVNDDEKLGRGLAQLHQNTQAKYGFMQHNYCGASLQKNTFTADWQTFYSQNRIIHLVKLISAQKEWTKEDNRITNQFLAKIPQLLSHETKPALIHGDLWSGNWMCTNKGPALIDPCVSYSDREFELGMMTLFGGFSSSVFDAYHEFYPLPSDWKERNQIYQLYHVLNHYLLFGGYYKQQAILIMKHYL